MTAASAYRALVDHFKQANLLQGTAAILSWDQETMMPAGGVEYRGEQLAQIAGLVHRMKSDPKLGDLLDAASRETGEDPLSAEAVNVREWTLDLAVFGDSSSLLLEWTGDRLLHLQRALALAGAGAQAREIAARLPGELLARLRGYGVVRGLGAGERHGLIDRDGQPVDVQASATLPPETPGVVRVELLRRDGRDLMPDRLDPRLSHTGFRLVGDAAFVRWVRAR